jgi:hypothetical protein
LKNHRPEQDLSSSTVKLVPYIRHKLGHSAVLPQAAGTQNASARGKDRKLCLRQRAEQGYLNAVIPVLFRLIGEDQIVR